VADPVKLIGLDFGTTTSSAVIATARLTRSAVSGRVDLAEVRESYRSEMVFTPLDADSRVDEQKVAELVDGWLAAGRVRAEEIFGGGALLTGLTAEQENAASLVRLIRGRLGDALVATADDPCLESWLAFMGSCAGLSRSRPELLVLNLDIGGGTTNLALGRSGEVSRTGCLYVGARHVEVGPGTYRIVRLSKYAAALLDGLGIRKGPGDCLTPAEVDAILDFYIEMLEAVLRPPSESLSKNLQSEISDLQSVIRLHEHVPFHLPPASSDLAVTFSGGVGELIYAHLRGAAWPSTTCYGDLGIDLAQRLCQSERWLPHLRHHAPASAGRATVYGLLRHATEVSGSTVYLPQPAMLPLADIPILGSVSGATTDEQFREIFGLALRSRRGAGIRVRFEDKAPCAGVIRELGGRLTGALRAVSFPAAHPLVLLVQENAGKALGHYVSAWGALPLCLAVVDEIVVPDAQYVHIGRPRDQVVPVSFYGLKSEGESA
jgi:ethanolamine utilization protein EutA